MKQKVAIEIISSLLILNKKIIRPSEKDLKEIGDVFFDFSVTKRGSVITHFNFIIKTKDFLKKENEHLILVKENTANLFRQHFGFKTFHMDQIKFILNDFKNIPALRSKLTELALKSADRKAASP